MYSVGDTLPIEGLDPGTYLLSGPAMAGKYDLLLSLVTVGLEAGEGALVVSTNEDAAEIVDDVEERLDRLPEHLRLVDCVSEQRDEGLLTPDQVEYVSSPADLTGIGIGVSEQLRRFAEADVERTRVAFSSLSTLLTYAELETVFRFLHVLTGRIASIDGVGVFAIDPTTHEESTVNTLEQLFDGTIELRDDGDGRKVRLVGVEDGTAEWRAWP